MQSQVAAVKKQVVDVIGAADDVCSFDLDDVEDMLSRNEGVAESKSSYKVRAREQKTSGILPFSGRFKGF